LNIVIRMSVNEATLLPRLAQLTAKTNQFNLTTRRYTEGDIERLIAAGAMVFSASVTDRFGDYGTVIEAIVIPGAGDDKGTLARLDVFLMSCRVMGRGIECRVMDHILRELHTRGVARFEAEFAPSAKNKPAESFLRDHGFIKIGEKNGTESYAIDIPGYIQKPCLKANKAVTIIS
jgi:FkbH-like protein